MPPQSLECLASGGLSPAPLGVALPCLEEPGVTAAAGNGSGPQTARPASSGAGDSVGSVRPGSPGRAHPGGAGSSKAVAGSKGGGVAPGGAAQKRPGSVSGGKEVKPATAAAGGGEGASGTAAAAGAAAPLLPGVEASLEACSAAVQEAAVPYYATKVGGYWRRPGRPAAVAASAAGQGVSLMADMPWRAARPRLPDCQQVPLPGQALALAARTFLGACAVPATCTAGAGHARRAPHLCLPLAR